MAELAFIASLLYALSVGTWVKIATEVATQDDQEEEEVTHN